MRKDPLNPKYTKIETRVDHIIREVIRIEIIGQTVETEDSMENNRPRQNYRDNNF